jgi:hypothetical protein
VTAAAAAAAGAAAAAVSAVASLFPASWTLDNVPPQQPVKILLPPSPPLNPTSRSVCVHTHKPPTFNSPACMSHPAPAGRSWPSHGHSHCPPWVGQQQHTTADSSNTEGLLDFFCSCGDYSRQQTARVRACSKSAHTRHALVPACLRAAFGPPPPLFFPPFNPALPFKAPRSQMKTLPISCPSQPQDPSPNPAHQ